MTVLASVLLAGLTGLAGPWDWPHVVVLGFGGLVTIAGIWAATTGHRNLQAAALAGLTAQLALFLRYLAGTPSLTDLRLIQIATVLVTLAVMVSVLLILIGAGRTAASLSGLAIGLVVVGADVWFGSSNPRSRPTPRDWPPEFVAHPKLGRIPPPSSEFKARYPDSRNGYLEAMDRRTATWEFQVMPGSIARLTLPPESPERLRVTIEKGNPDTTWHVQLSQARFRVVRDQFYYLSFKARADRPRPIGVGFGRNYPPWTTLGLYQTVTLRPEWSSFREILVHQGSDDNARVIFDLAAEAVAVEIDSVALRGPGSRIIEPLIQAGRYYAAYRTNTLGCRDRDYPAAGGLHTTRILVLGNAFAAGDGVREPDTFSRVLEHRLDSLRTADKAIQDHEVINCGVHGYGTHEQRVFFETLGQTYHPDIVIAVVGADANAWHSERRYRARMASARGRLATLSAVLRRLEAAADRRMALDYHESANDLSTLDGQARALGAKLVVAVSRHGAAARGDALLSTVRRVLEPAGIPILDLGRPGTSDSGGGGPGTSPGPEAHRAAALSLERWLVDSLGSDQATRRAVLRSQSVPGSREKEGPATNRLAGPSNLGPNPMLEHR
jgi:hypothetical protein